MRNSLEVAYNFSINGQALGHGDPIRVKAGQRVLFRILNASAAVTRRIAAAAVPQQVGALGLGPAERIDAIVEMNQPGVWILGATDDHDREHGMGTVIEYSGRGGQPRWTPPSTERWDYRIFGNPGHEERSSSPFERILRSSRRSLPAIIGWISGPSTAKNSRRLIQFEFGPTRDIAWYSIIAVTRRIHCTCTGTLSS